MVILVNFADVSFTSPTAKEDFTALLNEKNYSENKATGSARDFFSASSNGIFTKELKDENNTYEVTIVFGDALKQPDSEKNDENIYQNIFISNFNIDDYILYNQANRKENTVYLLYIFTEYSVLHLYDLGQVKINDVYVSNNNAYTLKTQSVDPNAGIFNKLLRNKK